MTGATLAIEGGEAIGMEEPTGTLRIGMPAPATAPGGPGLLAPTTGNKGQGEITGAGPGPTRGQDTKARRKDNRTNRARAVIPAKGISCAVNENLNLENT